MNIRDYIIDRCQVTWGLSEDDAAQVAASLESEDAYLREKMGHDASTFFDTAMLRLAVHKKIDAKATDKA